MVAVNDVLNDYLWRLRDAFRAEGFDLRLVGGCVRDLLAGLKPKDVDLHTDANPDECVKIYEKAGVRFEPTGLQHGTISVIFDHVAYEITSLRADVDTDGRHATVAYTRDWLVDLERRDFTINAMSMSFEGEVLDPFGGAEDLKAGVVKFVGNADKRIREDYLRILRWFRFRGRFEKISYDGEAYAAVCANAGGLWNISRERVWSEISKILSGNRAVDLVNHMHEAGVAEFCNITALPYYEHVCKGTNAITRNPVTMLVALYDNDAPRLLRTWKASGAEINLATKLSNQMFTLHGPFYAMAVLGWSREEALELAALNLMDEFDRAVLESWVVPVFPVTGYDLLESGMKPGPDMGRRMNAMKAAWAKSGYLLTKQELMIN